MFTFAQPLKENFHSTVSRSGKHKDDSQPTSCPGLENPDEILNFNNVGSLYITENSFIYNIADSVLYTPVK